MMQAGSTSEHVRMLGQHEKKQYDPATKLYKKKSFNLTRMMRAWMKVCSSSVILLDNMVLQHKNIGSGRQALDNLPENRWKRDPAVV